MKLRPYVVRQGDYLTKLAHEMNFPADKVWECERNRELRQNRTQRDVLAPGDVLCVTECSRERHPVLCDASNRYRSRVPKVTIRILLKDVDGPLRSEGYTVEGLGVGPVRGQADESGQIELEASVYSHDLRLVLRGGALVIPVLIGHLDPITETSGVRMRLRHLGYLPRGDTEVDEESLANAVRAFQSDHRLDPTGLLDERTLDALREFHGS